MQFILCHYLSPWDLTFPAPLPEVIAYILGMCEMVLIFSAPCLFRGSVAYNGALSRCFSTETIFWASVIQSSSLQNGVLGCLMIPWILTKFLAISAVKVSSAIWWCNWHRLIHSINIFYFIKEESTVPFLSVNYSV